MVRSPLLVHLRLASLLSAPGFSSVGPRLAAPPRLLMAATLSLPPGGFLALSAGPFRLRFGLLLGPADSVPLPPTPSIRPLVAWVGPFLRLLNPPLCPPSANYSVDLVDPNFTSPGLPS